MKNYKSHFVFNQQERNGIFILVIIVIFIQLLYFFWGFWKTEENGFFENEKMAEQFQAQVDSLKQLAADDQKPKIFPFNPNFITDYKGYTLGMSTAEIDRLLNFRKEDKWVNSAEDFQKVTGVSDSLLSEIQPFFKFPEFKRNESRDFSKTKKPIPANSDRKDLNTATAEELQEVSGLGQVLSKRIVLYRDKIGGFVDNKQLKDVYGLNPEVRVAISDQFAAKPPEGFQKLDINKASLLQLSEIPYFNYELAREIIDYRLLNENINSFEELTKIKGFPSEKIERIELYLTLN